MKQIIILSDKDISDIESGRDVECKMRDGSTVVLMDDITYEKKHKKGENDGSRN